MEQKFNFIPFEKVLVRIGGNDTWKADIFSHMHGSTYVCIGGYWNECIPYAGNERFIRTTDPYKGKSLDEGVEPMMVETPYQPSDGDFIAYNGAWTGERYVGIVKDGKSNRMYLTLNLSSGEIITECNYLKVVITPATDEERRVFFNQLHKKRIDWDADKKKVVDYRWRPKNGELFYYIRLDGDGKFSVQVTSCVDGDELKPSKFMPYKTKEEAQAMCDKMNEAFENIK